MFVRGVVGAAIGATAVAVVALLLPVVSRWVDGTTRPAPAPDAIATIPDDTGPALRRDSTATHAKKHTHAKPKHRAAHEVLVGGNVVVLAGTDAAPAVSAPASSTPAPAPDATLAPVATKRPAAKPKAPQKVPAVVADESNPVAPAITTPAAAPADAASTGLVRLSVQSVGIAPNAAGDPELQAKLAIGGAEANDALPDTVTLHLRPQIPDALQSNNSALALNASVDMVDAPRATPSDPALRMRVRMAIAPSQTGTPASTPVVQDPGPADGKSNVIGLTVALKSFVRAPEDGTPGAGDPTTPPDNEGPGGPTTPPDNEGPGGPTTPPDNQGPGDPTQQPGDPATPGPPTDGDPSTPPQEPAPGDPATPPGPPTGGDPATPPEEPAPGDPATTPAPPTGGDAITLPSTEILIPVGPVRPNEGVTDIPVAADPTDATTPTDSVPIVVIVEELPPADPPAGQADPSTPVVQDPAPEVAPPADTTDPGTPAAPDAGATDGTAIVVSADAPPSQPTTS